MNEWMEWVSESAFWMIERAIKENKWERWMFSGPKKEAKKKNASNYTREIRLWATHTDFYLNSIALNSFALITTDFISSSCVPSRPCSHSVSFIFVFRSRSYFVHFFSSSSFDFIFSSSLAPFPFSIELRVRWAIKMRISTGVRTTHKITKR